jgi:rhodanese-related sulfurtransferase
LKKSIFLFFLLAKVLFGYTNISNYELEQLSSEDAIVVDVRLEDEWIQTGIIKNSKTVTYFDKNARPMMKDFLKSINTITANDKLRPIIVMCRSGQRSVFASEALDKAGYKQVYNLKYGILGWMSDGKKLVKYQK